MQQLQMSNSDSEFWEESDSAPFNEWIPNSGKSQIQHRSMSNSDSEFWEESDPAPFNE
ncbi:hypothetical protein [Vibrio sp. 070316B]|uniref:hypothetical protein n=1 Tax=Vibrio sp. 070316B TaxID=2607608 RepID=UPI001493B57B|nr:hypothetical protein [Vibrio sp. 070316B]